MFETDDHPNLDPPEQVGRVSWKQNGRTLCSVWFPDDAQGWRFHMAGDDCGWSRTRYDTPEAAALAYWDAVHAYPTTAPWFASTDAAL